MKKFLIFNNVRLTEALLFKLSLVALTLILGLTLAKILKSLATSYVRKHPNNGRSSFLPNFIFYIIFALTLILALDHLNINIKYLLGTAGFLTVALGFASQTSVSNIISGFFLMSEKPFVIGDTVKIDNLTGEILSIDLLSTRLRTIDNLLVRIPNETLMKANIINYTYFPIRRVDISLKIGLHERIDKVKVILFAVAHDHPLCFDEPKPVFFINEMGEWVFHLQFSFWTKKESYTEVKNAFIEEFKKRLEKEGVNLNQPIALHLPLPLSH